MAKFAFDMTEAEIDRFWQHIPNRPPGECWLWDGSITNGYGIFRTHRNGKRTSGLAHRIMYIREMGDEEFKDRYDVLVIRHTCDNPMCVNPEHLTAGYHKDNVADRVERGRSAVGQANGRSKFTPESIRLIRHCLSLGMTPHFIAGICQVDAASIRAIRDGRAWQSVA